MGTKSYLDLVQFVTFSWEHYDGDSQVFGQMFNFAIVKEFLPKFLDLDPECKSF